ncbi:LysR family transcriptional regulator [Streptomyces sp. NPDC007088]|uniref:LysR family transcriptional regulator n=1 Tax=Streptomyces sp. NPDC007088 TaxID=3364773 RepID=UPI0036936895
MLERVELEAFLTLAGELHFGRTAERLAVTTGRVSQVVRRLESRIGGPLFERTNRSVRLTPLGQQLYEDLHPAYEQIRAGLARAADTVRGARDALRVGFVGVLAGQVVHRTAAVYPQRVPGGLAEVREVQIGEALDRLRDGSVDVLVLSLPLSRPDIVVGPVLVSEPRMLAVPVGHPLAARPSVTTEDLADIPLVRLAGALPDDWPSDRMPERTPSGRPVPPGPRAVTFQEALLQAGASGAGVIVGAQVTRFYQRPDLVYVPFSDAPPIQWAATWLRSGNGPRNRSFAHVAREIGQDLDARGPG